MQVSIGTMFAFRSTSYYHTEKSMMMRYRTACFTSPTAINFSIEGHSPIGRKHDRVSRTHVSVSWHFVNRRDFRSGTRPVPSLCLLNVSRDRLPQSSRTRNSGWSLELRAGHRRDSRAYIFMNNSRQGRFRRGTLSITSLRLFNVSRNRLPQSGSGRNRG
jgi:hypothetical protein